jgi:elongation factor G
MPKFAPAKLRNVAILGHSHEGKTSLAEAFLFSTGAIDRLGKPDAGNTTLDFEPEETRRHVSISLAAAPVVVGDVKVNLLDTPGFFDFASDVRYAVSVADAALIVAGASDHMSVGTEIAWELAAGRPKLLVINKLDKENTDFDTALNAVRAEVSPKPVAVQIPIGRDASFRGVVDLLSGKAYEFDDHGRATETAVPADMAQAVESARAALAEAAAEGDDELLEKFLEGTELTPEEVRRGLREAVRAGSVVPAVPCSATRLVGVGTVLQAVVELLPSPEDAPGLSAVPAGGGEGAPVKCDPGGPALAFVFKTTADPFVGRLTFFKVLRGEVKGESQLLNVSRGTDEKLAAVAFPRGKASEATPSVGAGDIGVVAKLQSTHTGETLAAREEALKVVGPELPEPGFAMAIHPKNRNDEAKIGPALQNVLEEDPGLRLRRDEITTQSLLFGFGDVQLEVACEKLKRKYQVEAELESPRVPFTETITGSAKAEKKYKKQSGGAGLYGHAVIEIEPVARGEGFVWEDKIFGGSIPQPMRPSVEKGVRETMETGVISGNPVVDVKVKLVDGSTHPVDGKDLAFRLAGSMAMREAVNRANPVLLEPIMEVTINVPDRFMGDVMSDVTGRRGKILGTDQIGNGRTEVRANIPQLELLRYALDLRSMTQGRGSFVMRFSHPEEMPHNLSAPIVTAWQKEHAGKEVE